MYDHCCCVRFGDKLNIQEKELASICVTRIQTRFAWQIALIYSLAVNNGDLALVPQLSGEKINPSGLDKTHRGGGG